MVNSSNADTIDLNLIDSTASAQNATSKDVVDKDDADKKENENLLKTPKPSTNTTIEPNKSKHQTPSAITTKSTKSTAKATKEKAEKPGDKNQQSPWQQAKKPKKRTLAQ